METTQPAFDTLKAGLTTGPILWHFDPLKHGVVEANAFDYILGAVFS
jgi:hypothetical protein